MEVAMENAIVPDEPLDAAIEDTIIPDERKQHLDIFSSEGYYDDKLVYLQNIDMQKMMDEQPDLLYITLQAIMPVPIHFVHIPKLKDSDLIAESASSLFNVITLAFWQGGKQHYTKKENQKASDHMKELIEKVHEGYLFIKNKELTDVTTKLCDETLAKNIQDKLLQKKEDILKKISTIQTALNRTKETGDWLELIGLECLYGGDSVKIVPYSNWVQHHKFQKVVADWKDLRVKAKQNDEDQDPLIARMTERQLEIYNFIEEQKQNIKLKKKRAHESDTKTEKKPKGRAKKYQSSEPTTETTTTTEEPPVKQSTRGRRKKVVQIDGNPDEKTEVKPVKVHKKRAGYVSVGVKAIKPDEEWNIIKQNLGDALAIDSEDVAPVLQALAGLITGVRNRPKTTIQPAPETPSEEK